MNKLKEIFHTTKSKLDLEEKKEKGKKYLQQSKDFVDMNKLKEIFLSAKSKLDLEGKKEGGKKYLQQSKELIDMNRRKLLIVLGGTIALGTGTYGATYMFSSKNKTEKEYEELMELKNKLEEIENEPENSAIESWNSGNSENRETEKKFQESLIKIKQITETVYEWENIFEKKEKGEFMYKKDREEIHTLFEDITNSCFEIEANLSLYYQNSYDPANMNIDISDVVHMLGEIKNSFDNENNIGILNLKEKLLTQHKKLTKLSAHLQKAKQ